MSVSAQRLRLSATPVLAVGVIAIGFAALLIRLAAPTHPLVLAGLRLGIAACLLAPFTIGALRSGRLDMRALRLGALGGAAYAVHFGAWVRSLELTSVAASVTIVTSTPLMLAVVALITGRDKPTRRHWLAIALGLAGLITMAFMGVPCTVGSLLLLGTAVIVHVPIEVPSTHALVFITLAALVPQLIGHGALTYALGSMPPTVVGMATVGEPVVATLLAFLFLGENVDAITALGCVITLGGVMVALSRNQSAASPRPSKKRSKIS